MAATGIFNGADSLIHHALGLQPGQNLKQISACAGLKPAAIGAETLARLVEDLHDCIFSNWAGRMPSKENWRLERQVFFSPGNVSPEVVFERAVAMLGERGALENWYNQIPVASGMIDGTADKRAAVDLLRVQGRQAALVELKWASDTPAFAAFEILRYGLAYLLCRDNRDIFAYGDKELMRAERISLQVLAPRIYYERYDLGFLGEGIRQGLDHLCHHRDDGLRMDFQFLSFPTDFQLPFASGQEVLDHRNAPLDKGPNGLLIEAMNNLQPIWDVNAS